MLFLTGDIVRIARAVEIVDRLPYLRPSDRGTRQRALGSTGIIWEAREDGLLVKVVSNKWSCDFPSEDLQLVRRPSIDELLTNQFERYRNEGLRRLAHSRSKE